MHYIKMILGELKSHRDSLSRSIDKMQRDIDEAEENQVRNKELRDLVEELMSARTASFAPEEKPIIRGYDPGKDVMDAMVLTFVDLRDKPNSYGLPEVENLQRLAKEMRKPQPEPEPKDPHENDRFGKFKVVDGEMVRVCNCDFCKKRSERDGR